MANKVIYIDMFNSAERRERKSHADGASSNVRPVESLRIIPDENVKLSHSLDEGSGDSLVFMSTDGFVCDGDVSFGDAVMQNFSGLGVLDRPSEDDAIVGIEVGCLDVIIADAGRLLVVALRMV